MKSKKPWIELAAFSLIVALIDFAIITHQETTIQFFSGLRSPIDGHVWPEISAIWAIVPAAFSFIVFNRVAAVLPKVWNPLPIPEKYLLMISLSVGVWLFNYWLVSSFGPL